MGGTRTNGGVVNRKRDVFELSLYHEGRRYGHRLVNPTPLLPEPREPLDLVRDITEASLFYVCTLCTYYQHHAGNTMN
jgi:hypothetical protein